MSKIKVGVLGATGAVGQRFIQLLADHPWFEISALGASERSAGKPYHEAVNWKMDTDIPESIKNTVVSSCEPTMDCKLVFSGLDASVAGEIEESFAKAGYAVVSNAKNYRTEADVPLLIPEVNPDHLEVVAKQKARGWEGFIITNPNCVAIPMSLALKPIHDLAGIDKVFVTTMQAVSGAGYPGVPSMDIYDNVVPYISGEEPKVESEPKKILGAYDESGFTDADITISSQCNRVATRDGHLLNIAFSTKQKVSAEEIKNALQNFTALPQELDLPSAPKHPVFYHEDDFRPQTYFDRNRENGMSVTVGRLRECSILDYKLAVLGHNTIRGAAGAAILNAELLYKKEMI